MGLHRIFLRRENGSDIIESNEIDERGYNEGRSNCCKKERGITC